MKVNSDLRQGSLRSSSQHNAYDPWKQTDFRSGHMQLSDKSLERAAQSRLEGQSRLEEQHENHMKTKKLMESHRASRGGVANADLMDNTAAKSPHPDPFARQLVVPEENQLAE